MPKNKTNWTPLVMIMGFLVLAGTIYVASSRQTSLPTASSCEVEPYIDLNVLDGVNTGTAVASLTTNYAKNGAFVGSFTSGSSGTKFAVGDKIKLLVEKANYIAFVSDEIEIKACGSNPVTYYMYATDDSTLQLKNSAGVVLTDAVTGGATNQSASSTNIDIELKITGNADQSSGDMVCVFEADNTTMVNDLILSGASKVDVPEFYTVSGASAIAKAYEVPQLVDGDSRVYNLRIEPESSAEINSTGVYTTCYTKQAFKDVDGSFVVGVEDSDGTNKYEDDFDYDFYIPTEK